MRHQLHHRPEIDDIRVAYDSERSFHSDFDSEQSHHPSQSSSDRWAKSYSTQPTIYSATSSKRPPRVHQNIQNGGHEESSRCFSDIHPQESPRASIETYASTVQSEEDLPQEIPAYEVPEYTARPYEPTAIAATPSDFSELFPSHRRLAIRHDDSTLDGNMNLRLDTEVTMHGGRRCDMTLFHLRMHDLRDREFSLRRYCRDSGREICHSSRKLQRPPTQKRPGFQRSLSNALSSMRSKSEPKSPTIGSLKRNDSGYGSVHSAVDLDCDDRLQSSHSAPKPQPAADPNTVKLEFSNYAQLDLRRTGRTGSKRYEFEYWGRQYCWKKAVHKEAQSKDVSYHLIKAGTDHVLAYIIPSPLTPAQAEEEQSKGGWIPPCSMWIADESIVRGQKDVADVIVASGLVALVDDSIRARFHSRDSQPLFIPKLGVEYVGPKRLINEMFKRG
ncbi:Hypothetical predicted protein [Lecanosticta acicola]|uniref:Uncharacterized protein n=1 Tax=Lecanosticta acicola TaxID=111012 RepID=A0AAI9EAY5_9PEZI|nr:Hypothetical predicted protein [Lecanosticta acicola]